MKTELLEKILQTEKSIQKPGSGVFAFGDEWEVTMLFQMGDEVLSIPRTRQITLQPELLIVDTFKGERFYLGPDTPLRGIKFAETEAGKKRGAGFTHW